MAELVGGALLSDFFEAVIDRLTSEETLDLFRGNKLVIKLLDELNIVLISANKLLKYAEEKQIGGRSGEDVARQAQGHCLSSR